MSSTGNFFFDFAARKRNIFSRPVADIDVQNL